MNGYFQIQINEKGVSILLSPPIGVGEPVRAGELREYLDRIGVSYDITAINSALCKLENDEIVLFLTPTKLPPVDEKCSIKVSDDGMAAVMRLYPPSVGGVPMSLSHVQVALQNAKVTAGIDEGAIREALADKHYCTDIVVARGKHSTPTKDAVLQYHFDTNNQARPELKEDGSVDFFKLNTLHHCEQGQVLAEITPGEQGESGVDVYGKVTPAREANRVSFSHGKNIMVSPDGLKLISMVNGHVSLVDNMVFVSDVYAVEDVGTSTGNIEYHADVEVRGNVCENFSVKVDGSVFVQGVVEGASIEAGGDIVIARGMHGQNKGKLKAGGNIIAKFISAAEVAADGFVEAEQILNSKVTAGVSVNVEAGKGLITGGKIVAKNVVYVRNAGSPMGASTIIEVGADPEKKKRLAELQKSVGEKAKKVSQMKKNKAPQAALAEFQKQVDEELKEIDKLSKMLKREENAHIDIRGTMYQGVAVSISGATMTVKNEYTFCRLVKNGADVASTNL